LDQQGTPTQQPHKLQSFLSKAPQVAGGLVKKTGLWLLDGVESAMDLAGLHTQPAGHEIHTPSVSGELVTISGLYSVCVCVCVTILACWSNVFIQL